MKIVVKAHRTDPIARPRPAHIARSIGDCENAYLSVFISENVMSALQSHSQEDLENELGGILVGDYCHDKAGPFIDITGYVRADKAKSRRASLEFDHDAWREIHSTIDAQYAECRILGWFHTHPGYGIFLSGYDQFIDENWFNQPYHVAAVLDPSIEPEHNLGIFVWTTNAKRTRVSASYAIYHSE